MISFSPAKEADRISAIRLFLRIMRYIGLWAVRTEFQKTGCLIRFYGYLLHMPLTFTFIFLMWVDAFISTNLEEAGQILYMSLTEIALIVKILNIWYHRDLAWQYIHELKTSQMFALRTQGECDFWNKEQRFFKWIFYVYLMGSISVLASGYISVLFLKDYELAFPNYIPFEWRRPDRYWYAYSYNFVAMTMTCVSNVTLDAIGCYFLFHLALLYRLLGMRLLDLQQCKQTDASSKLRSIFNFHNRLHGLNALCQRLSSPYILSQIVLSAFILCFCGFRMQYMVIKANPAQFISMLQFVSVMILQIFLPCYFGNEITMNSNQLTNMVYNTNWLQFQPKTRRILITYMEFLKRPAKIKAGNFFDVGLPIFVKTINNAYSLLAVLLNASKD